jgi:hypothetical protein
MAEDMYRELGHTQGVADTLSHLALAAYYQGQYEVAQSLDDLR